MSKIEKVKRNCTTCKRDVCKCKANYYDKDAPLGGGMPWSGYCPSWLGDGEVSSTLSTLSDKGE